MDQATAQCQDGNIKFNVTLEEDGKFRVKAEWELEKTRTESEPSNTLSELSYDLRHISADYIASSFEEISNKEQKGKMQNEVLTFVDAAVRRLGKLYDLHKTHVTLKD